jgi:hypothetical protein
MLFGIGKIPAHSMTPLTRELRKRLTAASLSAGLLASTFGGPVAAESQGQDAALLAQVPQSQRVDPSTSLQLKVRRLPDAIELIIEGTGPGPQLQQGGSGSGWQGQLFTATPAALRVGPQRLSLPEVGLQSISFDGGGQSFSLAVTPAPGINLGRPVVSADGRDLILTFPSPVPQASLQTNRLNMAQPGAVPLPTYAPPLQPRAVAPPLGDMAVGTMTLRNPGYVNLSGPPVTMTMKNAPARCPDDPSPAGGYGFAYIEARGAPPAQPLIPRRVCAPSRSLAFRGENFGRAFNTALLAAWSAGQARGQHDPGRTHGAVEVVRPPGVQDLSAQPGGSECCRRLSGQSWRFGHQNQHHHHVCDPGSCPGRDGGRRGCVSDHRIHLHHHGGGLWRVHWPIAGVESHNRHKAGHDHPGGRSHGCFRG